MRKILFVLPRLTSGGAERQAVTLATQFKRRNNEVSFLCYAEGAFFEEVLKKEGIPVYWRISNNLRRIISVTSFIRRGRYDVVISFMPTPNFLNCFAAIFRKNWIVITSERSSLESDFTTFRGKVFGHLQKFSDTIVCNSDNARNMWLRYYPDYKDKLKTIYNAVDIPLIGSKNEIREAGRVRIIVAATIFDVKNPMGLLKALLLMNQSERSKIKIDWYGHSEAVIGDHKEYDLVVKTIQNESLSDIVTLHKPTMSIFERMQESDFVALFSQYEGLPNVICEAMMLGKPIIMSRCSDYNILVEEGENGYLCDWDKPISIKEALMKAVNTSNEKISLMGAASLKKAKVLFSPQEVVSQWMSIL